MKVQKEAIGVLERTSHYLRAGVIRHKPAWYDAVAAVPPSFDATKKPKNLEVNQQADPFSKWGQTVDGYRVTRASGADRQQKNRSMNRVPKLEFLEDQLRDVFYHQHPWEFARPKVLVESDGNDQAKCDWSRMLQFRKPLDGESVVQRTLWLLQDAKARGADMTLFDAYDTARFEFYQLRMAQEMEAAVAKEEAEMFGAQFESTNLQWGLEKEQEAIDRWATIGDRRTKVKAASRNKTSASVGSTSEETTASIWETTLEEKPEEL